MAADVVRKIEITAALSPDYQSAFKAAAGIAKDTSAQINALTKRESDLQKLLALDAQRAAAAQAGNAKEADKAGAAYDKLAQKLGVVGQSAAQLQSELKDVGDRRKDLEKLNRSASKQAAIGKAAEDVKRLSEAYKRFKDPNLLKALEQSKKRFAALGGAVPKEKQLRAFNGLGERLQRIPGPVGAVAKSFAGLRSILSGPAGVVAGISGLAVAAVAVTKKLWDMGTAALKSGDKIIKTADALGISTDAYQELSYAMQRGGASAEDFDAALKHVEEQLGAAAQGQGRAVKAFKQFGITVKDLQSMNAEEAFYAIAEGISKIDDPAKRMRASVQLLGGAGDKMAHAMRGGAAGLDELRKAARATGNVRTRKELENAAEAADKLLDAQLALKGAFNDVAYAVMPEMVGMLQEFAGYIRENKGEVAEFARAAAFAMKGVAAAVKVPYVLVQSFTEGIKFWRDAFVQFGRAVAKMFDDFMDFLKPFQDAFAKVIGWVVDSFKSAIEWITEKVKWIIDKVKAVRDWIAGEEGNAPAPVITGAAVPAQGAGGRAGAPQVTVQVSVDARGGSSETGAAVQRALAQSSSATTQGVERALNRYGELAEGA